MKLWRWLWLAVTLGVLAEGFRVALFVVPPDAQQGDVFRIFFYHFPSWVGMGLFYAINLACSLVYLAVRNRNHELAIKADALAVTSAEMGVVFCLIGLVTGSLWGRAVWGIWWTWDARLTSTLVLWLIYVAYLLLRRFAEGRDANAGSGDGHLRLSGCAAGLYVNAVVADAASGAGVRWGTGIRDRSQHDAGGVVESGGLDHVGDFRGQPAIRFRVSVAKGGAGGGAAGAGRCAGATPDGGREITLWATWDIGI